MHCTMDDLLALRANEGSVWARGHVAGCPTCQAELEALYQRVAQLKALPPHGPARDRWPAIREAIVTERRRRVRWGGGVGLAAAAAVAGLIVLAPFRARQSEAADLARVKQESATLEEQLHRYDPTGRVMSGRAAALVAELEDRIAVVDGELAQLGASQAQVRRDELVNLWQNRVDLMQQLVDAHVTRVSYVGL
jgi:uncharacterized small protein (DUF1192 family)